jgi:putative DNA primase/helicase
MRRPSKAGFRFDQLPIELTRGNRFVVWVDETRDGKTTKIPLVPHQPEMKASVSAPDTWGTFDDAIVTVQNGHADGVGRVLGDGLAVLDLDGCRDPIQPRKRQCFVATRASAKAG